MKSKKWAYGDDVGLVSPTNIVLPRFRGQVGKACLRHEALSKIRGGSLLHPPLFLLITRWLNDPVSHRLDRHRQLIAVLYNGRCS